MTVSFTYSDTSSDIIGASRVGIKTCWINREDSVWKHDIQPDYTIKSLNDVVNIADFDLYGLA
jgi:FMN phosphatase YigB (HAD superfamily)